jgi:signal transduction histidine kinase
VYRHAFNHDLPNQLVALQGLLQVLELEEGARLTAEGLDYVKRLGATMRRLQAAVVLLKAIGRVATESIPAEEIALPDMAREAAAEVRHLLPGRPVTYHTRLLAAAARGPRSLLQRALVELIRTVVLEGGDGELHLLLDSRPVPGGV